MEGPEEVIRRQCSVLMALAQTGLAYGRDAFDHERYRHVREAAATLLELISSEPLPDLERVTVPDQGYATPKVDVRGAVFDDEDRVLLIQERSDQRWTLPGGWCDVEESPSQAVCREVIEESGLSVRATRLAAVLDRERHSHWPPMSVHVYKLFFLCEPDRQPTRPAQDRETLDVDWFALDSLPELSISRVTADQLNLLHTAHHDPSKATVFD